LNSLRKIHLLVKEIGWPDLASYGLYQLQLRSGWLRLRTPGNGFQYRREILLDTKLDLSKGIVDWKSAEGDSASTLLTEEAGMLLNGKFHPFFNTPQPLDFPTFNTLNHWTAYTNDFMGQDIKFAWEPARFTWSLALAKAYQTTGDERYPQLFWQKFEQFNAANPVNRGPNWASAQEVALRAIMWILAVPAFKHAPATTTERLTDLTRAVVQHIERILPTLAYARSQHNNHILSEALGLMVGGDFLRGFDPRAEKWIERGAHEFERAILRQVDEEGNYSQHSANYQRMMLQLALLYASFMQRSKRKIPGSVLSRLALAARWLAAQLDVTSGRLPNLGHNDGTLLLPFGCMDYRDYRPTAQAAAIAFLGHPCLPTGPWDELSSWLGLHSDKPVVPLQMVTSPAVHVVGTPVCWASLRGIRYHNRPAHADQLHVEIWSAGENLARDAGTYLYNALHPWQNALDVSRVHNTITVDDKDQMQRISRFLWLDQAQAKWLKTDRENQIAAEHNGYRNLGIAHGRAVEFREPTGFLVTDTLTPAPTDQHIHEYRLHWLLPDWQWSFEGQRFQLSSLKMSVLLEFSGVSLVGREITPPFDISLIRAGNTLMGTQMDEILGWESDTYGEKHPVLSLSLRWRVIGSVEISTEWKIHNT
jgi:hypothetical protein